MRKSDIFRNAGACGALWLGLFACSASPRSGPAAQDQVPPGCTTLGCADAAGPAPQDGGALDARVAEPIDSGVRPPLIDADASEPARPDAQVGDPGTVIAEPTDEAAFLYDGENVHTFDVEIAEADLALVDADPSAEQYVPARVTFQGVSYEVGYRYKGSIGAFQPPCSNGGFQGGGPKTGKCSVKLSFDWMDPEARFFGLKKLQFHAMNNDPSMLRERLGYGLFRAMGVPAARAAHAVLRVNGQADIYALIEEIDGRFTRSRFSEGGEGNLYKEIWPVHTDPSVYMSALQTNEDESPSMERIVRFQEAIAESADAAATFMDLEVTSSYMAVDRVIMNDDGAFHFYCVAGATGNNPTVPGNHNYYWYEAEHADRFWIIPWDLDHSMNDSGQLPHISTDWRHVPAAGECMGCPGGGGFVLDGPAPGCDRVIQSFQAWQARYEAKVDAFIAGPFAKAGVDAKIDRWTQQIADAGFTPNQLAIDALKAILDRARENRGYSY